MNDKKCTSWLGHKFEARYQKSAAKTPSIGEARGNIVEILEAFRDVTYVHDICVRCGEIVRRE